MKKIFTAFVMKRYPQLRRINGRLARGPFRATNFGNAQEGVGKGHLGGGGFRSERYEREFPRIGVIGKSKGGNNDV